MISIGYNFSVDLLYTGRCFDYESRDFVRTDKDTLVKLLRESEQKVDWHYIGGGSDSVYILDSSQDGYFIIEPCSGILFANDLLEFVSEYEKGQRLDCKRVFGIDETIFRHYREDEYLFHVEVVGELGSKSISFSYGSDLGKVSFDYTEFVVQLLEFGMSIFSLFERILPEINTFRLYEYLKHSCVDNSFLKKKFEIRQRSEDVIKSSFMDMRQEKLKSHPT